MNIIPKLENIGYYKRVNQSRNYKQYSRIYDHYEKVHSLYNYIIEMANSYDNQSLLNAIDNFYEKVNSYNFKFMSSDFPNYYHYKAEALENQCETMLDNLINFLPEKQCEIVEDDGGRIICSEKFKYYTYSIMRDFNRAYTRVGGKEYKNKYRKSDFSKQEWFDLHFNN